MEAASPDIDEVIKLFTDKGWPFVRDYLNTTNQPVPETMTGNVNFYNTFKGKPLGSDKLYDCKLEQDFGDGRFLVNWLGDEQGSPGGEIIRMREEFELDELNPPGERKYRDEDK